MRSVSVTAAAVLLVFTPLASASALNLTSAVTVTQWYTGGTLHRATASQWTRASYANKLATASDWVAAILGAGEVRRRTGGNIDRLRPYAAQVVACVDEVAPVAGNQQVAELAAACMVLLGYRS
jgi:hypothetical protein